VEWLKVKALSSNHSITKKKKNQKSIIDIINKKAAINEMELHTSERIQ
jgi:hypothetical protein